MGKIPNTLLHEFYKTQEWTIVAFPLRTILGKHSS